jgi:outer membrane protein OmpA-like peptidoglycan-associated protein
MNAFIVGVILGVWAANAARTPGNPRRLALTLFVTLVLSAPLLTGCSTTTSAEPDAGSPVPSATGGPFDLESGTGSGFVLPAGSSLRFKLADGHRHAVIVLGTDALGFDLDKAIPSDPEKARTLLNSVLQHTGPEFDFRLGRTVAVTGYASPEGNVDRNLDLSRRRADWVCGELQELGASTLTCAGRGADDVAPPGPGPEDRRVEIVLRSR